VSAHDPARTAATAGREGRLPIRAQVAELQPSGIREIAHAGMGRAEVIALWFGEPDLPTPDFIIEAADRALRAGETFYSHNRGVPELRHVLAEYTGRLYGRAIDVERITVTSAAMNALMLIAELLVDPGDNIVLASPLWPNFFRSIEIMAAEARQVPLATDGEGWRLDLDRLFDACDERTRAICVNSPSNPTGWMMERETQAAILDFCRARGLWVIADEVYARIVYDRPHAPSFLEFAEPDDLLLVVNSFSKSWAMSGWRLGWITAPVALGEALEKLNEYNVASPATGTQHAGITAVREGEPFIRDMVERYRIARDIVQQRLGAMRRVRLTRPEAAFYAFFSVEGVGDSRAFAKKVLAETGVGLAPGTAFGKGGESFLRICYAKTPELLGEAFDRLEPLLDRR
jgi:aspartate/methionine/tyrosine aminotransferase